MEKYVIEELKEFLQKNESIDYKFNLKNFVFNFSHPLVKLSGSKDPDEYKKPIERSWQDKRYLIKEVKEFIKKSHGIGINIASLAKDILVIDIDDNKLNIQKLIEFLSNENFNGIVLSTPKGAHIITKFSEYDKIKAGRQKVIFYDEYFDADIFTTQQTARQIVLPIFNTHRYQLGCRIVYFKNKDGINKLKEKFSENEIHSIEMFLILFYDVLLNSYVNNEFVLKIIKNKNMNENEIIQELNNDFNKYTRAEELFGKKFFELKIEDFEEFMKNKVKVGERHNLTLTLSVLYKSLGFSRKYGWNKFKEMAYYYFDKNNIREVSELEKIIETADKKFTEIVDNRKEKRKESSTINIIKEEIEKYFGFSPVYAVYNNNIYLLDKKKKIAYEVNKFILNILKIPIGINAQKNLNEFIKILFKEDRTLKYLVNDKPLVDVNYNVYLSITFDNNEEEYVLCVNHEKKNNKKLFLISSEELPDGYYLEYLSGLSRNISRKYFENIEETEEFTKSFLFSFFNYENFNISNPEAAKKYALALSALVSLFSIGIDRLGLLITGTSGSGKTSFSKLIQMIVNGNSSFTSFRDKRDFISAACSKRVIAVDEAASLSNEVTDFIKTVLTTRKINFRKLFTDTDLVELDIINSYIISSVDFFQMKGDLFRRFLTIDLSRKETHKKFDEKLIEELIEKNKNILLLGILSIYSKIELPFIKNSDNDLEFKTLFDLSPEREFTGEKTENERIFKAIAKYFDLSEKAADYFYKLFKNLSLAHALGSWREIIYFLLKNRDNKEVVEKLKNGFYINELIYVKNQSFRNDFQIFVVEKETNYYQLIGHLTYQADQIIPLLSELGITLSYEKSLYKNKEKRKYYLEINEEKFNEILFVDDIVDPDTYQPNRDKLVEKNKNLKNNDNKVVDENNFTKENIYYLSDKEIDEIFNSSNSDSSLSEEEREIDDSFESFESFDVKKEENDLNKNEDFDSLFNELFEIGERKGKKIKT